jgi:hypothetical protein
MNSQSFFTNSSFYTYIYQGYSDGLSYFTPGLYTASYWSYPPNSVYNDKVCPNVPQDQREIGYDCRCRTWY